MRPGVFIINLEIPHPLGRPRSPRDPSRWPLPACAPVLTGWPEFVRAQTRGPSLLQRTQPWAWRSAVSVVVSVRLSDPQLNSSLFWLHFNSLFSAFFFCTILSKIQRQYVLCEALAPLPLGVMWLQRSPSVSDGGFGPSTGAPGS